MENLKPKSTFIKFLKNLEIHYSECEGVWLSYKDDYYDTNLMLGLIPIRYFEIHDISERSYQFIGILKQLGAYDGKLAIIGQQHRFITIDNLIEEYEKTHGGKPKHVIISNSRLN
ncbi:MAG: hypothetical protein LBV37_01710 [Mycoplasmataceae bacterium]|jgi:hypothetical protein|nr:hypothetical protein [Mycoplasmataceae bacterium]